MVKKNLKSALRAHEVRKLEASKASKAAEAANRKAASVGRNAKSVERQQRFAEKHVKQQGANGTVNHDIQASAQPRRQRVRPFEQDDTILLVGEGNFSFAHSLLLPPNNIPPSRILATAFDSEQQCYEKYPDADAHVREMRRLAGRESIVLFGIDAGHLAAHKSVRTISTAMNAGGGLASWSKIVFNFPHVGAGHKDERRNILSNQVLILRFLISASSLLSIGEPPSYVQSIPRSTTAKSARTKTASDESEEIDREDDIDYESDANDENVLTSGETVGDDATNDILLQASGAVPSQHTPARPPPRAGSVLITLRNCKPYTLWDVPSLAKRMSSMWHAIVQQAPSPARGQRMPTSGDVNEVLRLGQGRAYRVWRSYKFEPNDWPGYSHRRTIGWREGVSTANNEDLLRVRTEQGECRTWQLGLAG